MKGTTFILVRGSRIQCNIGRLRWQKLDASGHEFTTTVDSVTNAGILTAGISLLCWTGTRNWEPNKSLPEVTLVRVFYQHKWNATNIEICTER